MEIQSHTPNQLRYGEWEMLQALHRVALGHTLEGRSSEELDVLTGMGDTGRYIASHLDPNVEVGRGLNPDQSFSCPRVTTATEGRMLIGFAYTADNVSGETERTRRIKGLTVVKNYLWLREVVVTPEHQGEGVATDLVRGALRHVLPMRRVSTYIWPDEIPSLQDTLERHGFQATGEQQVRIFGQDSNPVRQVRMQAPVGVVRRHLRGH